MSPAAATRTKNDPDNGGIHCVANEGKEVRRQQQAVCDAHNVGHLRAQGACAALRDEADADDDEGAQDALQAD